MSRAPLVAACLALLLLPSVAHAQPADPGAPLPPSSEPAQPPQPADPGAPLSPPPEPQAFPAPPPPAPYRPAYYPETAPGTPPPPAPAPVEGGSRLAVSLFAGPSLRDLYGIGFYGADFGVQLGGDWPKFGLHGVLEGFAGTTAFGLVSGQLRFGVSAEGRVSRFRFGGGLRFGFPFVRRITNGTTMVDFTVGPELHFSVDVLRWAERAVYVAVRGNLDFLLGALTGNSGTPLMGELSILLGVRL